METMRSELTKLENSRSIRQRTMTNDIERFLKDNDEYSAMQQVIGYNMLFRGFIVLDWFRKNKDERKYKNYNRTIIKLCVQHY